MNSGLVTLVYQMVIEFLTFDLDPQLQADWLRVEEQHWSRFLERQPGFVRKEMWRPVDDERRLHAVIWWESIDHWHAVPDDQLEEVASAMGSWERIPVMQAFDVVRDC